jgi:GNAT superfamily N-acetyltransferase
MLKIRPLEFFELPLLKDFAPPEWNTDLSALFSLHFGQPYFYPIAAELDGAIVGCAMGLWNGNAGWLGNIIVLPECRGRGIGYALTKNLVKFFHAKGCASQILIATKMGEPVYRKLGFEIVSQYVFLKAEQPADPADMSRVRPYTPEDSDAIFRLDQSITGENRHPFLGRCLLGSWMHETSSGELDGFYLPGLPPGPVLAKNDEAGLELLRFKIGQGSQSIVVPEANRVALQFLLQNGFQETARTPRMILGKDVDWHPEQVYSRGAGYCG